MSSKKKKIQPVNEDLNTLDPDAPTPTPEADGKTVVERLQENAPVVGGKFDDQVKAELGKVEALEAELVNLTKENDDLKEKLAEYIEKTAKLQKAGQDSDEIRKLRDENDKYLMRISELTFENAKLTAKIQNIEKNGPAASRINRGKIAQPGNGYANVYRNGVNANGYSSWN